MLGKDRILVVILIWRGLSDRRRQLRCNLRAVEFAIPGSFSCVRPRSSGNDNRFAREFLLCTPMELVFLGSLPPDASVCSNASGKAPSLDSPVTIRHDKTAEVAVELPLLVPTRRFDAIENLGYPWG